MSIFNRVAGTEEPKIPVWPLMMDFTRVLDEEISFAEFAAKYQFSQAEQIDAVKYLTAIGTLVTTRQALLLKAWNVEGREDLTQQEVDALTFHARLDARGTVDNQLRYGLLRAEQGTITEAALKATLGMTV